MAFNIHYIILFLFNQKQIFGHFFFKAKLINLFNLFKYKLQNLMNNKFDIILEEVKLFVLKIKKKKY